MSVAELSNWRANAFFREIFTAGVVVERLAGGITGLQRQCLVSGKSGTASCGIGFGSGLCSITFSISIFQLRFCRHFLSCNVAA